MARRVVVEFVGDAGRYNKTVAGVENRTSRLGNAMRRTGKVAALGLAAGAVVAAKGLYDMGRNAAEDAAGQRRLALALKNSAGATKGQVAATENWISAQGKALGVTDDELRPALQRFVSVTHDIGKAQKLASLAMDVSAGSGKSLESVSASLARAQNGNLTGMARLGVATKDANGETLSLDQVMKNAAKTFKGQAAASADSLQGKMGRLQLMFDETKEAIGARLIPIATKFADWMIDDAIPAVSNFTSALRAKLGPVIEWVRGLFGKNTDGMASDFSRNFANIKATIQSFVSIVQSLWARFGGTITATVRGALNAIRTIVGGQLNIIAGIFKTVAALLKGDWSGVWAGLKQIARGAVQVLKGIVGLLWNGLKAAFRIGASAIRGIFGSMWNGLKSLARAGLNGIVSAVKALPARLKALGGILKSAGKGVLTAILNGLKGAGGFAGNFASSIWNAIKSAINRGIDSLNNKLDFKIGIKGAPDIHVNAPNIGHLAKGTNNWRGGPTWVGEKGPEILNLPKGSQVTPNNKIGSAGTTINIVVNGAIDPDAVANQIRQMLLKLKRTNGGQLGLA